MIYLSHRIIDSFPRILKPGLLAPRDRISGLTKLVLILLFLIYYSWNIVLLNDPILDFSVCLGTDFNAAILIRFKAILEYELKYD